MERGRQTRVGRSSRIQPRDILVALRRRVFVRRSRTHDGRQAIGTEDARQARERSAAYASQRGTTMTDAERDPVLRRALEELRRVPPPDVEAMRRVVAAAATARVTPFDGEPGILSPRR